MLSSRAGSIINVSSVNGQTGLGEEAYSAAKAGVINLTQNLAVKYGPQGIRVNCVVPGTIETNLWKERIDKDPNVMHNLRKYYPLGRIGKGQDVANAIWFLASEQASWITGVSLNVDGGLMAGNSGLQRDLVP
jgi:NAD(P)-dependent dehydrogenase (short-subunit alcohol dehydrogenase family)